MSIIVSGFPGVGKSHLFRNSGEYDIVDSDSSQYSWIKDENGNNTTERNPNFIPDYMAHIQEMIDSNVDVILVSSHNDVRRALRDYGHTYILVYPNRDCKEEYLERYRLRGSTTSFIELLDNNWNEFIDDMIEDTGFNATYSIILDNGEYLTIESIIQATEDIADAAKKDDNINKLYSDNYKMTYRYKRILQLGLLISVVTAYMSIFMRTTIPDCWFIIGAMSIASSLMFLIFLYNYRNIV